MVLIGYACSKGAFLRYTALSLVKKSLVGRNFSCLNDVFLPKKEVSDVVAAVSGDAHAC